MVENLFFYLYLCYHSNPVSKIFIGLFVLASFAIASEKTLFVLPPYTETWFHSTPVVVECENKTMPLAMSADTLGWFRYTWKKADYRPEVFFLYGKSDSLRLSPIGKSGFAFGRTDLVPFGLEDVDSLFLVPDLNYSCYSKGEELYGDSGIVYLQDIRKNCPLKKLCLEKDFVPACYQVDFNRYPVYYSIYSKDSVLVKGEKALLPQYDCVYGGFNPGCANRIFVENGFCQLASGDYLVKIRDEASDSSFFLSYSVTTTALFPERPRQNIDIRIENSFVRIRSASPVDFAVFNSLGQFISHGNVLNSDQIKLPASGNYLLKVGTETHCIQIK